MRRKNAPGKGRWIKDLEEKEGIKCCILETQDLGIFTFDILSSASVDSHIKKRRVLTRTFEAPERYQDPVL